MAVWSNAVPLRILISGDDSPDRRPLYEAIVRAARAAKLAGAKVTWGITGYARSGHIHETWRGFSCDMPVVIELIDTDEKIDVYSHDRASSSGRAGNPADGSNPRPAGRRRERARRRSQRLRVIAVPYATVNELSLAMRRLPWHAREIIRGSC